MSCSIPVFCATAIQISGTSTPSRSSVTMVCCFMSMFAPPNGNGAHGCPRRRQINQAESRLAKRLASGHPVSFWTEETRLDSRPPVRAWSSAGPFDPGEPSLLCGKPDSCMLPPHLDCANQRASQGAWHETCPRVARRAASSPGEPLTSLRWRGVVAGRRARCRVIGKKDLITYVISTPNWPGP